MRPHPPHPTRRPITIPVKTTQALARMNIAAVPSVTTNVNTTVLANAISTTLPSPCANPYDLRSLLQHLATPLHNLHRSRRPQAIAEVIRPSHQPRTSMYGPRQHAGRASVTTNRFPEPQSQRQTRVPSMSIPLTASAIMRRSAEEAARLTSTLPTRATELLPPLHVHNCVGSTRAIIPRMHHVPRLLSSFRSTFSVSRS